VFSLDLAVSLIGYGITAVGLYQRLARVCTNRRLKELWTTQETRVLIEAVRLELK
jgi:hypothetical protein